MMIAIMTSRRFAVAALAMSFTLCVFGADLRRGDVLRTGTFPAIMCPTPPPGALYSPALEFKGYLGSTGLAIAVDGVGNVYNVDGMKFEIFDPMLQSIRRMPLPEPSSSLAVDAAGFAYVIGESGTLYVYSPAGFQRSFTLPNLFIPSRFVSVDIAPDGCTLVYTGVGGAATRFDACAGVPLPDIAKGERFDAVRALRDGGFAGAAGDHLEFYDGAGRLLDDVVIRAHDRIGAFAFDIDPDYVWIATDTQLARFNFRTRTLTVHTMLSDPHAVAVFGENRPSSETLAPPPSKRHGARH